MRDQKIVNGFENADLDDIDCSVCSHWKLRVSSKHISKETKIHLKEITNPFECIHADNIEKLPVGGHKKSQSITVLVDDLISYLWCFDLAKNLKLQQK